MLENDDDLSEDSDDDFHDEEMPLFKVTTMMRKSDETFFTLAFKTI